jgi:hypothetical protein
MEVSQSARKSKLMAKTKPSLEAMAHQSSTDPVAPAHTPKPRAESKLTAPIGTRSFSKKAQCRAWLLAGVRTNQGSSA